MGNNILRIVLFFSLFIFTSFPQTPIPTTINDFFLSGSQPNQSGTLEDPNKCDNCHGGYDSAVEPAFNWRGGMMSQAQRDPLYLACLTVANQDAAFVGDLCIRCHSPKGWLEGRSIPTNGSALTSKDREGVQCDFCHKLVKPTPLNVNPFPGNTAYTSGTYPRDQIYLATLNPISPTSANGMYIADNINTKRGPFVDADPTHQFYYSPFHSESDICGTCHDVSNPAFTKQPNGTYALNDLNNPSPSMDPYTMFPVERTFSEWKKSAYNTLQGIYAPQFGGNKTYVSTCQDCHMKDVTGRGCNKASAPLRTNLPAHDQTGGNTWIPDVLPSLYPGEVNVSALQNGKQRAIYMLQNAATLQVTGSIPNISVKVINETAHKLPSGYPEGRRMWINVKAYDQNNNLLAEFGAYDTTTAILTKTNTKVYEVKLGMSSEIVAATGRTNEPDSSSFHFVLNNRVVKDNRIPPRGFTNANFASIQASPVNYSYADSQYWDVTNYTLPVNTTRYAVNLYYQTASKEYVEFLKDKNVTDNRGTTLYNAWLNLGKSAPVLMETFSYQAQITSLAVKFIPEGFYNTDSNTLNRKETVSAYLRSISSPYNIVDSSSALIDSLTFSASFNFANVETGYYYLVIKHLNSLETWSRTDGEPIVKGSSLAYDFTNSQNKAFGNNLVQKGTMWCIFSGDVNQDGLVDLSDVSQTDTDNLNFVVGYVVTDVNGDNIVDLSDISIVDINNLNFVAKVTPTFTAKPKKIEVNTLE